MILPIIWLMPIYQHSIFFLLISFGKGDALTPLEFSIGPDLGSKPFITPLLSPSWIEWNEKRSIAKSDKVYHCVFYDQHLWLLATAQFLFLKSDKSVFGLHWREKTKDQQSKKGLFFSKTVKDLMVNNWLNAATETKTIESCYVWPKKRNAFSLILLQVSPQKRPLFTSDESGQVLNYLPLSSLSLARS